MNATKKMLSGFMLILAGLIAFGASTLTASPKAYAAEAPTYGFTDVNGDEWFAIDEVLGYATDHGIISGYNDGRLGAYDDVTRGQVAVILHRLAGEPDAQAEDFADVDYGAYYGPAIRWARSTGVINGYWDEAAQAYLTFGPDDPVTREQLAAMLANYAREIEAIVTETDGAALNRMPDAGDVDGWARESVGWAMDAGLMSGVAEAGGSYVRPLATAQRCAMAKMASALDRGDAIRNATYKKIIDEYRNVLTSDYVKNNGKDWQEQSALKAANPDVNAYMFPSMIFDASWKYAFVDINEDGVQELLVGAIDRNASGGGIGLPVAGANHRLADVWTYTGGNLQRVTYGTERSFYTLCEGGVLFNRGSSGAGSGVCRYMKLKDGSLLKSVEASDDSRTQECLLDDSDNYYLLGEYQWDTWKGSNNQTEYHSRYTYSDGTVQEVEYATIPDAYRNLAEQYPGETNIDWLDF